jgi:small subunit ribosomal protein S8
MTDPIADLIIRIKNALMARKSSVSIPYSRVKQDIANILMQEGYVTEVVVDDSVPFKNLEITLKYIGKLPAVNDVKRLSSPGRRLYSPASKIPRALGGYGITIISTSRGIMTDKTARKENVGGELLCQIW